MDIFLKKIDNISIRCWFHNIIFRDNKAHFIDFEYAGWDDPGKLFCDLILQPDHNIPIKYISLLDLFVENYIFKINYQKIDYFLCSN